MLCVPGFRWVFLNALLHTVAPWGAQRPGRPRQCDAPKSQSEMNSFLWRVTRAAPYSSSPSYLFGTIHVPYTRVWDFIPDRSKQAFHSSHNVFFELDLTDPLTISKLTSCQLLPHGENLQTLLPRDLYRRLKRHLDYVKHMMPYWMTADQRGRGLYADYLFNAIAGNWERKRPVWVMLMVNSLTEWDVRSRGTPVLDLFLAQEAERMRKTTGAVERVEEQCHPLNGLNFSQVLFALNQTLLQHEGVRAGSLQGSYTTEDLITHYNCGDLSSIIFNHDTSQLPQFINSSLPAHDRITAQQIDHYFRQELIYKRNERMARRVSALLQRNPNQTYFFAFGAGHFLGNHSVLEILRQEGYEIVHIPPDHQEPFTESRDGPAEEPTAGWAEEPTDVAPTSWMTGSPESELELQEPENMPGLGDEELPHLLLPDSLSQLEEFGRHKRLHKAHRGHGRPRLFSDLWVRIGDSTSPPPNVRIINGYVTVDPPLTHLEQQRRLEIHPSQWHPTPVEPQNFCVCACFRRHASVRFLPRVHFVPNSHFCICFFPVKLRGFAEESPGFQGETPRQKRRAGSAVWRARTAIVRSTVVKAVTIASEWSCRSSPDGAQEEAGDGEALADGSERGLDGEGVWSPDIEQSFQEALAIYPPCGRRKIILSDEGKMYGRNELIARYIKLRTGKTRTRKQVSSHIQVLARKRVREYQSSIKAMNLDQVSKDKALQTVANLSSAQIVSASVMKPQTPFPPAVFWPGPVPGQPGHSQDIKPFAQPPYTTLPTSHPAPISYEPMSPPRPAAVTAPVWQDRTIASSKLRLMEYSAFLETQKDRETYKHLFVHIGPSNPSYSDPVLESIDVRQIYDKFSEKKGGLKELYEKGPRNAFFLVKFWADLSSDTEEGSGVFYGVSSQYSGTENITISVSTKVCSFGKQVVEKVETEYAHMEGGKYMFRIHRSPMCEYMINFIHKLKHLPEKYMMNSVLENFTILQVVSNRETQETLLCIAFVFEVSTSEHGAQYHVYRLVDD